MRTFEPSYEDDPIDHIEPIEAEEDRRVEFYRKLVQLLASAKNTKFVCACYLIASGDAFADGVTMTELAGRFGVTKAAVSKQCVFICAVLSIPPSKYMRDELSKENFRASNPRKKKQS